MTPRPRPAKISGREKSALRQWWTALVRAEPWSPVGPAGDSVPVRVWLEGPRALYADVVRLLLREDGQLRPQRGQVQAGDLLVELLGQQVHLVLVPLLLRRQQVDLRQHLVRERARHHEGRVPSGAAQIQQAPRRQDDDAVAIREHIAIDLRLNVLDLDSRELFQVLHLDLVVEVSDVAYDGVVLHLLHVLQGYDLEVARGCGEDVDLTDHALHCHHLEALHASLQSTDRIDLCDQNPRPGPAHRERATLAHVAIAADQRSLPV